MQGSSIGPQLYIIMKSDLKPISTYNNLFKYADDTTLLVPEHSAHAVCVCVILASLFKVT